MSETNIVKLIVEFAIAIMIDFLVIGPFVSSLMGVALSYSPGGIYTILFGLIELILSFPTTTLVAAFNVYSFVENEISTA